MSGTVSFSLQQQFDGNGDLLVGGLFYSFASGTTTAQNAFRDIALTSPYSNPIQLDASGRVPQVFFADGTVRVRITDANGVVQFDGDALPVLGSSSSGTPTAPTDPNAILATGDIKARYGIGTLAGFVRANGNNISNAGGGGTERANVDCQNLFQYLWGLLDDVNLTVTPSRGASAVADFTSVSPFKQVKLPDLSGTALCGLDNMGGGDRDWLGNWSLQAFSTGDRFTLGSTAGWDRSPLTAQVVGAGASGIYASTGPNMNVLSPHTMLVTFYIRL